MSWQAWAIISAFWAAYFGMVYYMAFSRRLQFWFSRKVLSVLTLIHNAPESKDEGDPVE